MVKRQQTSDDVRAAIVERLTWQVAQRLDPEVAGAIHAGEELDAVYPLGEVGLLDEFYHFLESSGVLAELATLKLTPVERVFLPVTQFVLLYLLKALLGIESMNALPALLFSNVAAMTLIGFNAHQIVNGLTQRGDGKRKKRPKADRSEGDPLRDRGQGWDGRAGGCARSGPRGEGERAGTGGAPRPREEGLERKAHHPRDWD